MKLLIAYDGSICAEAALDDLARAGLPDEAEALVLTVGEIWLSPKYESTGAFSAERRRDFSNEIGKRSGKSLSEAKSLARHAKKRLTKYFPKWKIGIEAVRGSAATEIIGKANEFKADLIVTGSHGRGSLGRFLLGSVSNKVLSEAACSVRVSRGRVEVDPVPSRVVVAYDGSPGADAAAEAVAARNWREASEFRLVAVGDQIAPAAIERFVPTVAGWVEREIKAEQKWIEKLAAPALEKMRATGLSATLDICCGNPKQILVEEAARWRADSIFVGANGFGVRFERFLLGSVSAAVAARAHCSVEVVRKKEEQS